MDYIYQLIATQLLPTGLQVSPAPEYKVGLTQRPAGLLSGGPPRPSAFVAPRSITPRSGVRMRPRRSMSATHMSKSPADFLAVATAAAAGGTPGSSMAGDGGRPGSTTPNGSIFVPRENPRRLFVRDALPSTEAAGTSTASPALAGTPGRPAGLRTPGARCMITAPAARLPACLPVVLKPLAPQLLGSRDTLLTVAAVCCCCRQRAAPDARAPRGRRQRRERRLFARRCV